MRSGICLISSQAYNDIGLWSIRVRAFILYTRNDHKLNSWNLWNVHSPIILATHGVSREANSAES